MTTLSLLAQIESILFMSGEPVAKSKLIALLDASQAELTQALTELAQRYQEDIHSGLMLIEHADKVEIATKAALATTVEAFTKSTLQETLSRAALEVLSIVAYRAPIARSDIEAIRGVNCSYTLRALLIRGLIERQGNPEDARGYLYRPSFQFLEYLGLSSIEDLPNFNVLANDERMQVVTSVETSRSDSLHNGEPV